MTRSANRAWTTPEDLKAQVQRLWERGELLRCAAINVPEFPLRLKFKGPSAGELTEAFESVARWLSHLKKQPYIRLQMRAAKHRVHGTNALPQAVWIDDLNQALALIGKQRQAQRFTELLSLIRTRQPELEGWVLQHPLRLLELGNAATKLLDVIAWLQRNPRPDIYLRQVELPGIDSKFMERHRRVLSEWLDITLPESAIDTSHTGVAGFTARYGFRGKPTQIRMRVLDGDIAILPGPRTPDLALDAVSFAELQAPARRLFVTENEINFLTFPEMRWSCVLFGAGYGWEALAQAQWLHQCELFYWGDIDTHGFAILDSLRAHFPQTRSLLMDEATLIAHEPLWGHEKAPVRNELSRLDCKEQALFNKLRENAIGENLRLEQEHIGYRYVREALRSL